MADSFSKRFGWFIPSVLPPLYQAIEKKTDGCNNLEEDHQRGFVRCLWKENIVNADDQKQKPRHGQPEYKLLLFFVHSPSLDYESRLDVLGMRDAMPYSTPRAGAREHSPVKLHGASTGEETSPLTIFFSKRFGSVPSLMIYLQAASWRSWLSQLSP